MVAKPRVGFLLLIVSLLVIFAGCYRMNVDTLWGKGVTADGDRADPAGLETALPVTMPPVGSEEGRAGAPEEIPKDEFAVIKDELETAPGIGPPIEEESSEPMMPDTDSGSDEHASDPEPEMEPPDSSPERGTESDTGNDEHDPGANPEVTPEHGEPIKRVALTFDDGPDSLYTPSVLEILQEYGIRGTFFLVGTQVEKFQEMAKRIVDEGHSIGNHTWNHSDLSKLSASEIRKQIRKGDEALKKATGIVPSFVRAPYGAVSKTLRAELNKQGRELIGWTVDPRDWAGTSVEDMRTNINDTIRPDGIILLHTFGGKNGDLTNTLELLPLIIEDLQQLGYVFVTIEELLSEPESTQK